MEVTSGFVFSHIKKRQSDGHKGTFGRVLLITGSPQYPGAAVLCTGGALQIGVGYGYVCAPAEVSNLVLQRYPEAVPWQRSPSALAEALELCDAVLVGNGLGQSEEAAHLLRLVMEQCRKPMVIDADGINLLARHKLKRTHDAPTIFTPHKGELARLLNCEASTLSTGFLSPATSFAAENHCILVCKDAKTVTVSHTGDVFVNTTGNAGLAKAGSGDVLAGIIAGLLAQGHDADIAAAAGVWLHGAAGDIAAERYSQHSMLPHQVCDCLGDVFLRYLGC